MWSLLVHVSLVVLLCKCAVVQTCSSNPCSLPLVCESGQTCSLDKNCYVQCLNGSISEPECSPDPCSIPFVCDMGQTCSYDENCYVQCSNGNISEPECSPDPCSIPFVCDMGQTCSYDENCYVQCSNGNISEPECSPDPCSIPFVCDIGQTCSYDENCYAQCSNGNISEPKCSHDPCIIPLACDSGQICSFDENCSVKCTPENTSNEPVTVCLNGLKCYHGNCNINGDCDCNTGWLGNECDETSCPPDVVCLNGYCELADNNAWVDCICDQGWTGNTCGTQCQQNCSQNQICRIDQDSGIHTCKDINVSISTLNPLDNNDTKVYNRCMSEEKRPDSERICPSSGHECDYGRCIEENGSFHCECDYGSEGPYCENVCCLYCNNGYCRILRFNGTEEPHCNCFYPNGTIYTGDTCSEEKVVYGPPDEVTWYLWLVGVCVVVLVILIALLVVAPYIMWRYRNLMDMKIVHYFQKYEDDDDREWDAFVSYKSNKEDEHFVVHTLFPKLEKEFGFKLHLHFRDSIPGDTISNNIIRAVQGSRRTIMIISPQYIQSEFIRFEYEMAQQEMMKRKHRMLPILLEDISECRAKMDPNLKVILNSVTYIEWPKNGTEKQINTFWKKVQLSLPKKRHMEPGVGQINEGFSTKSDDAILSFKNEKDHNVIERPVNDYTTIDDTKLEDEEVYDIINDDKLDRDNDIPSSDVEPDSSENINPNKLGTDSNNVVDANVGNLQANKDMQQNYLNFLNSSNT